MPSPPITSREYAYFYVSGPGTHESVSSLLGLEPSQSWNVGDTIEGTGRLRNVMRWQLDSGLDDRHPISAHIEALLVLLIPRESQLGRLALENDLVIQCVGHYPPAGHGVHLSREVVRQAARISAAFDLDFYYLDYEPDGVGPT